MGSTAHTGDVKIFEDTVRLVAVGDIMLGRSLKTAPVQEALQLLPPEVVHLLSGEIVTGNLECLIGVAGSPSRVSHSHFQGDPEFSRSLVKLFDVVTLANNHAGDFGDEAIEETLDWLGQIGVKTVGIGRSLAAATEPATFVIRGRKIAVFGATTVGTLKPSSRFKLAEPSLDLYNQARNFSERGYACVLHLHTGGGDFHHPSPATRALLDKSADAGFIVVLGHHPHVVQGFVAERGRTIFYSLGDFLFDKRGNGRDKALIVSMGMGSDGVPSDPDVRVVHRNADLSLTLVEGEASDEQLRMLGGLSDMIQDGTSDSAYLRWRGSRIRWLKRSLQGDLRAGGLQALVAKVRRLNRRKLRELFQ